MKKRYQHGSAHVFTIIALVIGLIASLGFVFWQNFIYKEPVAQQVDASKNASSDSKKQDGTAAKEADEKDYLAIGEWGIKAKVPEVFNDTKLEYSIKDGVLYVVTARVKTILEGCSYDQTAGAEIDASIAIYRSESKSLFEGIDAPLPLRQEPYGKYYYGYSAWMPVKTCVDTQSDVQKKDANALLEMFKNLETVS